MNLFQPRNLARTVIIETNYIDYKVNPKEIKETDRNFFIEVFFSLYKNKK